MMENTDNKSETSDLRQKAEDFLKTVTVKPASRHSEADSLKLIHELQVHQIELELQNEELRLANKRADTAAKTAGIATQKYTELYDFSPSGYFTLSQEGKIIGLNFVGARMLGKERALLINNRFGLFVTYDTKPIFNLFLSKVFSSKTKETCEVILSAAENLPMYVHVEGIVSETGEQCFATVINITELKHAENVLRESKVRYAAEAAIRASEAKHSAMVANISDVIVIMGSDGIVKYISPNVEKWFGWQPRDLVGTNGWLTIHPDDFERLKIEFSTLLEKDNSSITVEYMYKCKDGSYKPIELTAVNLANDPVIDGVLMNYHDITERKRAEKALRESEKHFRKLFENHVAVKLIIDPDTGNIIDANYAAANYYGWPREVLRQMNLRQINIISPEEIQAVMQKVRNREQERFELKHKRADGFIRDIEIFSTSIKNSEGKEHLHAIIFDITERKKAEKIIQDTNDKLKLSNAEKDKFFSIIAHDLKSPFQGLLGLSELLTNSEFKFSAEELDKCHNTLRTSIVNVYNLLVNLLEWAQLQKGLIAFTLAELSLFYCFFGMRRVSYAKSSAKGNYNYQ